AAGADGDAQCRRRPGRHPGGTGRRAVLKPVVVVGGGIAGLTAALELAEAGAPVTVVEAGGQFGGKISTSRVDGLIVEAGADSFLAGKPAGLALCARLGITDRLINSRPDDRRTFVWSRGRLPELPDWSATWPSAGGGRPRARTVPGGPAPARRPWPSSSPGGSGRRPTPGW